jgi:hypothetical protein
VAHAKRAAVIDNELVQGVALPSGELLGIIDVGEAIGFGGIDDHSGGDDGSGPGSTPRFVEAGHQRMTGSP